MKSNGLECTVIKSGLRVSEEQPFLGASSDGIITLKDGQEGLIEVKNLLQNEKLLIKDAAKQKKSFCLTIENNEMKLKRNHKYFYQVQGQLNIYKKEWCDFVIRRTSPYDMYIERIKRDVTLWTNKMVPKLKAFYFSHILPELAVPRYRTVTGIRKPHIPWVICNIFYLDNVKTDLYPPPPPQAESPNFGEHEKPLIFVLSKYLWQVYKLEFKHTYKTFNNSTIFLLSYVFSCV